MVLALDGDRVMVAYSERRHFPADPADQRPVPCGLNVLGPSPAEPPCGPLPRAEFDAWLRELLRAGYALEYEHRSDLDAPAVEEIPAGRP